MLFRQIVDLKLSQYAYLIGCQRTGEAIVIDPERDIDQYLRVAEQEGVTITAVAETHIHADFLSGARAFAERGARVYLSDEGDENWKYEWAKEGDYDVTFLADGDSFRVGNIEIEAVHTPGHTPEHLSFLVTDHGGGAGEPMGIATGDFVFVGDLGRPDLLESTAKIEGQQDPSARRLYASAQRFLELPDFLQLWPGHGAGSACGKALGAVPQSTVGYERRYNAAIGAAERGEDAFVDAILSGQSEPPLYFARMKKLNKEGVPVLDELPRPDRLEAGMLPDVLAREGVAILDTRLDRAAFMARHLPGALYAPLNKSFNTAVGSVVADPAERLVLVIDEERVEEAVRDLVRVGYDHVLAYVTPEELDRYFEEGGEAASIEHVDFEALEARRGRSGAQVLDVRYASEYEAGHVPGAVNISYTRLADREDEVPADGTLFVHCAGGGRSAVAASLLAREGFDVQYVDGSFAEWASRHAERAGETTA